MLKKSKKPPLIEKIAQDWNEKRFCYIAVEMDKNAFQKCKYQDEKLVKLAVNANLENLQFVQDKFLTHSFALQIVKKHPQAVGYLPKRLYTRAIAFEALKQDPSLVYFLENESFQLKAVELDPMALKYCSKPSKKVIKAALKKNGNAIKCVDVNDVDYKSYALQAVKNNGLSIKYVDKNVIDKEICVHAINNEPNALEFVPTNLKPEVETLAQHLNPLTSIYAVNPEYETIRITCSIDKSKILYFKRSIVNRILKDIDYKNESWLLKFKIFLKRIGFSFVR